MDIPRKDQRSSATKYRFIIMGLIVAVPIGLVSLFTERTESRVELGLLRVATVEKGNFTIVVRAPGSLVPKELRWLAAQVGGRVEKLQVMPGANVEAGDIILELSNSERLTQREDLLWDLEEMQAQHQAELMNLESRVLDQQLAELSAKNHFESSQMTYLAQQKLRQSHLGSLSEIEFKTIKMQTTQSKQHWQIEKNRSINLRKNLEAQSNVRQAQLKKIQKQLARLNRLIDELSIRSPLSGVLQDLAVEPGEDVLPGTKLAKIVQNHLLIARIQVPEVQSHNIRPGQAVIIDTRQSKVAATVTRVSPSVTEGSVAVDVEFTSELPREAKPELSVNAEITIAALENTVFVNRPAYSQNHRQMQIFKLDKNEKVARKISVAFGRGSASLIEVESGLAPGDKIIVSDQSAFEKFERLAIDN